DVETQISYPIEISMYGIPGLKRVQSTSIFGLSLVNVYFQDDVDIWFARRLVMERLSKAREQIPPGLGDPQIGPASTGLGRIFMYRLKATDGAEYTPTELRTIQDWTVKPMLRTTKGVTGVLSVGGYVREYQVNVDMNALLARGLTLADVEEAITTDNRNVGGSAATDGSAARSRGSRTSGTSSWPRSRARRSTSGTWPRWSSGEPSVAAR
ncbi:MAG: efflux RND transporter permease subunit, partial [Gemmatimonadota bacterium]